MIVTHVDISVSFWYDSVVLTLIYVNLTITLTYRILNKLQPIINYLALYFITSYKVK
jgi:hypothetical protein